MPQTINLEGLKVYLGVTVFEVSVHGQLTSLILGLG